MARGTAALTVLLTLLLLLLGSTVRAQGNVLFRDSFDGQEGTLPAGWKPWGAIGPNFWYLKGGELSTGNGDAYDVGFSYCWCVAPAPGSQNWTDYEISTDFWMTQDAGAVCLAVRWQDQWNYYFANLVASPMGDLVEIKKLVDGKEEQLAVAQSSDRMPIPRFKEATGKNQSHRFAFRVQGTRLTVLLDGKELLTAEDSSANPFERGQAALGQLYNMVFFDNVEVARVGGMASGVESASKREGYRVHVFQSDAQNEAISFSTELEKYPDVEIVQDPDGKWSIYIGWYATEQEAKAQQQLLETEGNVPLGVVHVGGRGSETPTIAAPAADPTKVIRVVVKEGMGEAEGTNQKNQLTGMGIYPAQLLPDSSGRLMMVVGPAFSSEAEAQSLAQELIRIGMPQSAVKTMPSPSKTLNLMQLESFAQASLEGDDARQAAELFATAMASPEAPISHSAYTEVRATIKNARDSEDAYRRAFDRMNDELIKVTSAGPAPEELITLITDALKANDCDKAQAFCDQLAKQNPNNGNLAELRSAIAKCVEGVTIETNRRLAEQAEANSEFQRALDLWEDILRRITPVHPYYKEARDAQSRLNQAIAGIQANPPGDTRNTVRMVLMIVGGLIGVVVVIAVLVMLKKKSAQKAAFAQMQAAKAVPVVPPAAPKPAPKPMPLVSPPTPTKAAEPKQGFTSVAENDRIRPGTMSPAPGNGVPAAAQKPATPPKPTPPTPVAPPAAKPVEDDDMGLKLDFLMDSPEPAAAPASPYMDQSQSSSEFMIPPEPEVPAQPAAAIPESKAQTPLPTRLVAVPEGVYYQQDFSDEEEGKAPRNWRGYYDYASLLVNSDGNGKFLRFEKKQGIGSAYYSCRFPEASGRVIVEFDIRCDDKNKYLLGFYIEKDEDFRQSIHTIVHRSSSKSEPTLRIQGEPVNYEFGSWRHVHFEIDLPRHLVDGFVDDKVIASGVRLTTCPKVINTLSIRDNLATTGVLLIRNIRISKGS